MRKKPFSLSIIINKRLKKPSVIFFIDNEPARTYSQISHYSIDRINYHNPAKLLYVDVSLDYERLTISYSILSS